MPFRTVAVACFFVLVGGNALAINRCIDKDGRISFQDSPCPGAGETIEVRPAISFPKPAKTPSADTSVDDVVAKPAPAKKEKNLTFDEWDRMTYIENRGLTEANADIDRHNAACEERRRFLDYQMRNSGVNLAGAVQANSRSRALQALSVDCASQLRRLVDDRDRIADELRYLREKERTGK